VQADTDPADAAAGNDRFRSESAWPDLLGTRGCRRVACAEKPNEDAARAKRLPAVQLRKAPLDAQGGPRCRFSRNRAEDRRLDVLFGGG
jgi:hypothetical protein